MSDADFNAGVRAAAQAAAIPCYETHHVTLGDKVYDAAMAIIRPEAPAPELETALAAADAMADAIRAMMNDPRGSSSDAYEARAKYRALRGTPARQIGDVR